MITRLDGYVGQLMKKLKDKKMDNNTIVIFTSVNGPAKEGGVDPKYFKSTGPFRGAKRELYEGGIRVPLIVRWPLGGIKPGTTTDVPSALWDILPTAAELTRTAAPKDLDGISLVPTLRGRRQPDRHEPLYWESRDNGFQQAVRDGDWKALRTGLDGALELYNLKTDPAETTNVADKNPDVIAKLETYLKTARTPDPNWPPQAPADRAEK
jgi:arylsulfatase A